MIEGGPGASEMARLCALLNDPEAPYAYTTEATPGTIYDGGSAPWVPLTVVDAQVTPLRQVLYHRQTVEARFRPEAPALRVCVNRMVGVLDDGREVPLGEVFALPEAVLRAAEGPGRCEACGLPLRQGAVEHEGAFYCPGCVG